METLGVDVIFAFALLLKQDQRYNIDESIDLKGANFGFWMKSSCGVSIELWVVGCNLCVAIASIVIKSCSNVMVIRSSFKVKKQQACVQTLVHGYKLCVTCMVISIFFETSVDYAAAISYNDN